MREHITIRLPPKMLAMLNDAVEILNRSQKIGRVTRTDLVVRGLEMYFADSAKNLKTKRAK